MVAIKKQLAPVKAGVNGYGYGNKKKFLTIHQTGNTNKGANAQMHANLQSRVYGASWHWQIDDKEAIQSFEHTYQCWHASDGRGDGNSNSIGIEGCINSDGNYVQSVKNMAELAAKILKDEGIPIENMRQHHDFDTKNRKNCPAQIRAGKDGINWNKFVQMVKDNMKGTVVTKPVATPVAPKPATKSINQLVAETKAGKHGNGDARKKSLGSNYDAVMKVINGGASSAPTPVAKKKSIYLPKSAKTWRVYKTSGPYTTGKEVGFLAPAQYVGLDYEIIRTLATDVYQIKTSAFGNVAIYAAKSTGATIK